MRDKTQEVRESTGVENGLDAGIEAAGEAPDGGGRLHEEGGRRGIVFRSGGGEDGDDGGDGSELDVGELLGPVADDLVLELPQGLELAAVFGGGGAQPRDQVLRAVSRRR